jgi:hypothetical protein
MRENMWLLCFWSWATSLDMMSSSCIHYHQSPCHYTTISWSILSCRTPGLFPKFGYCG